MGFIDEIAPLIQKYAPQYGIEVCSPVIAQAILESASGTSELAVKCHNYFGLKYRPNRCPTAEKIIYTKTGSEQIKNGTYVVSTMQWLKFATMENGVRGYFDFIDIPNYTNLKGVRSPKQYLENIKADGYATSIDYVSNLLKVIEQYNLTQYDLYEETDDLKEQGFYYNGVDYSPVFDPNYYYAKYVDLQQAIGNDANKLFQHFVMFGMKELRQGNLTFNPSKYKKAHKNLQLQYNNDNPLYYKHYILNNVK